MEWLHEGSDGDLSADFLHFGASDFPSKNPFKKCFKIVFFPEGACEGFFVKKAAVILHLHTFTPADLHLHTFPPADLDLHTFTPADLDLHTLTSADLHLHTLTPADLDLHILTPADLDLHTLTSADLLLLFFYSLLRRGRCRRSATKRNPFGDGRWTFKT